MQQYAAPTFNSSTRMSAPLVESEQETPMQEKPKTPIGVATMDMRGIVVLELRLVNQSRKAPPVHYWPGMPDYQRVVQHIGITPGQTRFVYPFP
ncbi:MAG TPA: hypothetical protein V6C86_27110 [Oculatellaceae cyanobacterium]